MNNKERYNAVIEAINAVTLNQVSETITTEALKSTKNALHYLASQTEYLTQKAKMDYKGENAELVALVIHDMVSKDGPIKLNDLLKNLGSELLFYSSITKEGCCEIGINKFGTSDSQDDEPMVIAPAHE